MSETCEGETCEGERGMSETCEGETYEGEMGMSETCEMGETAGRLPGCCRRARGRTAPAWRSGRTPGGTRTPRPSPSPGSP